MSNFWFVALVLFAGVGAVVTLVAVLVVAAWLYSVAFRFDREEVEFKARRECCAEISEKIGFLARMAGNRETELMLKVLGDHISVRGHQFIPVDVKEQWLRKVHE